MEDTLHIRTLSALAVMTAAISATAIACTPVANTDVAASPNADAVASVPPSPDLAAPAPDTGPAAANTTGSLSSTPASAPSQPPAVTPAPAPQATNKADLEIGSAVYARTCAMCHGPDGKGVPNMGAELKEKDVAKIKEKITKGTVHPGDKMPPMGAAVSAEELDAVAKYVAAGLPK